MLLSPKNALNRKKYDYLVLSQIYKSGMQQVEKNKDSLTPTEMALIASAGHAVDLVDALRTHVPKNTGMYLDFTIDTQANIGNAIIPLFLAALNAGVPESQARRVVADKVGSYLLFEIWNFYQAAKNEVKTEFELSMGFDFATGGYALKRQSIRVINKNDQNQSFVFDALEIGRCFAREDVHIPNQKKQLVGVDMPSLFERVGRELVKAEW